jgi:diphthamide biosynthesis methyltransferase
MANTIGFPKRYVVGETSSMYRNAIGKFTDSNHLYSLYNESPEKYDRDIIELFNQTKLYSNDFLNLITSAEPFYLTTHSDSFTYKIRKGVEYPKIIENLATAIAKPGVQGTMFSLVFDRKVFVHGDRISAHRIEQNVQLVVAMDPVPYGKGFKYTFTVTGLTTSLVNLILNFLDLV